MLAYTSEIKAGALPYLSEDWRALVCTVPALRVSIKVLLLARKCTMSASLRFPVSSAVSTARAVVRSFSPLGV